MMKNTVIRHILSMFVIVVLLLLTVAELREHIGNRALVSSITLAAEGVIETCADARHRPTCYERTVPHLLDEMDIDDVFDVIRFIRNIDQSYRFCHVLAHELGERMVAKDPGAWYEVIPKNPVDGLCSNGFIHGAAVARFSAEVLDDEEIAAVIPDLSSACEPRDDWHPTPLDKAMCYHGIGHLTIHMTDADTGAALDICERVAVKESGSHLAVCQEGVFMQLYQPLEPEDFALVEQLAMQPTKKNHAEFCAAHARTEGEYGACWREGWPLYRDEVFTAGGAEAFCAGETDGPRKASCYRTVLSVLGRQSLGDDDRMQQVCSTLSSSWSSMCYQIGATTRLEEDRADFSHALGFCELIPDAPQREGCFGALARSARTILGSGSELHVALCTALPERFADRCFAGAW